MVEVEVVGVAEEEEVEEVEAGAEVPAEAGAEE